MAATVDAAADEERCATVADVVVVGGWLSAVRVTTNAALLARAARHLAGDRVSYLVTAMHPFRWRSLSSGRRFRVGVTMSRAHARGGVRFSRLLSRDYRPAT